MDKHLGGEIAILALSLFLVVAWFSKGLQIIQIKQESWRQSNPAARAKSRRNLQSLLLDAAGRPLSSVQWARREAAKELVPQVLGAIFTATFFAVKPRDISSSHMPVTLVSPLRRFYIVSIFGVVLHSLFENVALWMCMEQLLGTDTLLRYKQVHSFLLSILGGTSKGGRTRYLLLLIDIIWMYTIPCCTFPLFCSYEAWPPRLLGTDITCWDNHFHWYLVFLSAYGLMGILVWTLSMVLRKANWPTDEHQHKFEGVFEKADDAKQGLRLQLIHERDGELSVMLKLKGEKPGLPTGARDFFEYVGWNYSPWRPRVLKGKVLLRPEESRATFQALLRQEVQEEEPYPELGADPESFLAKERSLLAAERPAVEDELQIEVEAFTLDGRHGLCITSRAVGGPVSDELMGCVGEWNKVAFLTTPHAVEPLPNFALTILKVLATLAWSAYVPPHTKQTWRVGITACLICFSLAVAAIWHFYKPSVFAWVNSLNVVVMFLAAAMSALSLLQTSLVPPGSVSTIVFSWLLTVVSAAATVGCLGAIIWTLSEDEPWGWAGKYLHRLSDWANKLVPIWETHAGDPGLRVDLSVSTYKDGRQKMKECFGIDDPLLIFLSDHGPVRIIEVETGDEGPDMQQGSDGESQVATRPRWTSCSGKEVLPWFLSGGSNAKEAAERTHQVRVVEEFRSWVGLVAMGKYPNRKNAGMEGFGLSAEVQLMQGVPGEARLSMCRTLTA